MRSRHSLTVLALVGVSLTACSYPIRNEAIPAGNPPRYAWENLPQGDDTLVIVTASGGGTRAAALAASVLNAMHQVRLASGRSLADKIDIISSVSGGSVTAGYFALHGPAGLPALERNFIRRDGMSPLVANLLNPFSLAVLSTPSKERIDLLIDYLDRQLFNNVTFYELVRQGRRPYLILNSADMVEGTPFPFTQYTMDLLCSDLTTVKISTAVAASAAFPVALSPVTLKNYCSHERPSAVGWMDDAKDTNWYTNPSRVAWARTAAAYGNGDKRYVHLLDGGIADNLGVAEPYRLLIGQDVEPRFINQVGQGTIKKIVFVMINARNFKPSRLDKDQATPGIVDMALASIDASIDRATFSTAERLRTLLLEQFDLSASVTRNPLTKANFKAAKANTFLLTVDFDAIGDETCRRNFHSIATSWALKKEEIDALMLVGGGLLRRDPGFQPALDSVGGHYNAADIPTVEAACRKVPTPSGE